MTLLWNTKITYRILCVQSWKWIPSWLVQVSISSSVKWKWGLRLNCNNLKLPSSCTNLSQLPILVLLSLGNMHILFKILTHCNTNCYIILGWSPTVIFRVKEKVPPPFKEQFIKKTIKYAAPWKSVLFWKHTNMKNSLQVVRKTNKPRTKYFLPLMTSNVTGPPWVQCSISWHTDTNQILELSNL